MEPGPWAGRPDSATRDASCPQRKGCVCLKHHPSSEAGVQPGPCLLSGSPAWGDQGGGAGWGEQAAPYPHPAIEAPLSICPDSGQGHTGDPGAALGGPARSPHSAHFVPTWMEDNAARLWQAQPPHPRPPLPPSVKLPLRSAPRSQAPRGSSIFRVSAFAASFQQRPQALDGWAPSGLAEIT